MGKKYVIIRLRHREAGFFSYMWESLRSLYPYHENIDSYKYYFDWNFHPKNFRVDSKLNHITTNVWEYYFEQPSQLSDDIVEYRKDYDKYHIKPPLVSYNPELESQLSNLDEQDLCAALSRYGEDSYFQYFHPEQHPHIEYDGIYTQYKETFQSEWRQGFNEGMVYIDNTNYQSNTFIYNKIIKHLVVPKSHVQNKIDTITEQFSNHNVLGVHVRSTDHMLARPTEDTLEIVDNKLTNNNFDRIFLMSDSEEAVNKFKNKYGNRLITHNSIRSRSKLPVHVGKDSNAYRISEDVIVEAYALSKTNFLVLSIPSNVNYFVRCLAPNLDYDCVSELHLYMRFLCDRSWRCCIQKNFIRECISRSTMEGIKFVSPCFIY